MLIRKVIVTGGIVAALASAASSRAAESVTRAAGRAPAAGAACVLKQYQVTAVRPYRVEQHELGGGHLVTSKLLGADVDVQAQPGLTAEWLWLTLDRHIEEVRNSGRMGDCPLDVKEVQVQVLSAGPGFTVRLTAPDQKAAEDIQRRAQSLAR